MFFTHHLFHIFICLSSRLIYFLRGYCTDRFIWFVSFRIFWVLSNCVTGCFYVTSILLNPFYRFFVTAICFLLFFGKFPVCYFWCISIGFRFNISRRFFSLCRWQPLRRILLLGFNIPRDCFYSLFSLFINLFIWFDCCFLLSFSLLWFRFWFSLWHWFWCWLSNGFFYLRFFRSGCCYFFIRRYFFRCY